MFYMLELADNSCMLNKVLVASCFTKIKTGGVQQARLKSSVHFGAEVSKGKLEGAVVAGA
jgi:hypothetical protein